MSAWQWGKLEEKGYIQNPYLSPATDSAKKILEILKASFNHL
ncbi:MAG TPA: hypothetical protein VI959_00895 [Alphaproteobacteria bacterium]|nr:hypothetical protein [Alphaproteobacteria bacterium]